MNPSDSIALSYLTAGCGSSGRSIGGSKLETVIITVN